MGLFYLTGLSLYGSPQFTSHVITSLSPSLPFASHTRYIPDCLCVFTTQRVGCKWLPLYIESIPAISSRSNLRHLDISTPELHSYGWRQAGTPTMKWFSLCVHVCSGSSIEDEAVLKFATATGATVNLHDLSIPSLSANYDPYLFIGIFSTMRVCSFYFRLVTRLCEGRGKELFPPLVRPGYETTSVCDYSTVLLLHFSSSGSW